MSFLVVTPARDEASRLPALAVSLAAQEPGLVGLWVVVDDGSTDGTGQALPTGLPFPTDVVRRDNSGGLCGGSAFSAWWHGVEHGLTLLPDAERVLKVDADVVLDPGHLAALARRREALVGGVLRGRDEAHRADYTRGPLKAYDRRALDVVAQLPRAVGFDVMDEVAVRRAGLDVGVAPEATASLSRVTGSSEGLLRGRLRGGLVSRWTGYSGPYFAARVLRHVVRRPYVLGAVAMLLGYLRAGRGPWPAELREALRKEQRSRLAALARAPRAGLAAYRRPA